MELVYVYEQDGVSFSPSFMLSKNIFMPVASNTNNTDKEALDNITTNFFKFFASTDPGEIDPAIIKSICIPETIIIKKTGLNEIVYDVASFLEPRIKILTDGTLTNFEESEMNEETTIIGNIAQRFSRYQKSGYLNDKYFHEYGNKFFQFIKTNNGWKINALIWEDDEIKPT